MYILYISAPMRAMGDKINSKVIATNAGCNIIPGFLGEITSGILYNIIYIYVYIRNSAYTYYIFIFINI
jgi:hypothetical protein